MAVTVQVHAPERGRGSVTLPSLGCCCCCCCCLHTVGGLIGAARATRAALKEAPVPADPVDEQAWAKRDLRRAPVFIYWNSFAVACLVTLGISMLNLPRENPAVHGAIALIFLPVNAARVERKYAERGCRFLILEAGHLMQNLCLLGTTLGLSTVPMGGFFEREIARELRLPDSDLVLYAALCG